MENIIDFMDWLKKQGYEIVLIDEDDRESFSWVIQDDLILEYKKERNK